MKSKVVLLVLLAILFCIPSAAFASPNDYGYDENAQIFNGTLENWENFVYGLPPSPVDPNAKDVMFLVRKWDKAFDDAMFHGGPLVNGAWQQAHIYQYLSGDKLGWTWNWKFKVVYSSNPIEGAIPLSADEMGVEGFYMIQNNTWFTDPNGNEIIDSEFHAIPPSLGSGLYKK